MIKARGKNKTYYLFPKNETSKVDALKQVCKACKLKADAYKVMYANVSEETEENIVYDVELKKGDYICIFRKEKEDK